RPIARTSKSSLPTGRPDAAVAVERPRLRVPDAQRRGGAVDRPDRLYPADHTRPGRRGPEARLCATGKKRGGTRRIGSAPKCPPPPQCRSSVGAALPQCRAVEDNRSIAHGGRLIRPPSGGSSRRFTSPSRGRAKSAFALILSCRRIVGSRSPTSSAGGRERCGRRVVRVVLEARGLDQTWLVPGRRRRRYGQVHAASAARRGASRSAMTSNQT